MNKIKNIYRTLILLLSLVLMPVEGWASDGSLVKGDTPLSLSVYIKDKFNYACFYFEKDGVKLDISSWEISNNYNSSNHINKVSYGWDGHLKDNSYVYYDKTKFSYGEPWKEIFEYKLDPKGTDIHNSKLVLLLSNDANLLTKQENLAGVKKMEFDLYTEDGLKYSAIKYGSKSPTFSKAESTSIIPTAATTTHVTLPDFNAKYLRWQLFESETATTPVASITDKLSNSSSAVQGSDLIFFNSTVIANEVDRTVTFDFSKLPEGAKVENYVLKCTWANNDDDAKVVTYKGNTYILQEPSIINGEYSFKFVKQETLDALPLKLSADNVAAESSHDVDAIYKDGKLEVSLKDIVPDILSDFGVADKKDVSNFYMRWVLADKDGTIISANSNNGALALRKTSESVGYYTLLSTDGSSLLPNGLDVTFELPSGSSWSSDMKVYCLLSNDLTGYEAQYGVITKEPSAFKSKINVKLYSPDNLPFKHYEGIANKKGDWDMVNGHTYQKTHEWEYYYYVDGKEYNPQILLSLPFQRYEGDGNDLEPRGYFRWYNYNTDEGSEHLKVVDETQTKLFKKGKWGLFANNIGAHPTSNRIGVNYSTSHVNDSWKGETIACDVSRYIDGMDESKTYLLHEPTLSIRYIFHILPKKKIADDIMAALCNHDDGDYTYEDNKKVTFGYKDEKSVTTLRLQLNDISRYSFYPMKPASLIKVVYNNDITEADFDKSKYVSVSKYGGFIEWRIYDVSKSKYCKLSGKVRFLDLSEEKLNDADWYNLEGSKIAANEKPVIDKGTPVFVVAYLGEGNDMCPVANFDVRFMGFHPMTHEQITAKGYNNRTISYLDEHYQQATKPISFDDDDDEQTVAAPTTPDDNQDRLPSRWDRRAYSFVYRDLIDYDATGYSVGIGHSPLHGDYGLYKTANISGISGKSSDGKDDYVWWTGQPLYDRTYEMTNGSQYGHFLYVDASDESRQIAAADFKANLCTGMQMIFSANVADMTSEGKQVPQVMFKLYGVNYDAEGNIQSQKLLHSFSSGDFKTNVDDLTKAKWYQVYGKIVIQKESGVENYSDFRVVIDNYCQNTEGADYAVDDIRIYIEPAKVEVLQEKPVCGGATTGTVKLKIVPEFITWTPTADGGMNANWNNDVNWHRSSKEELYDDGYTNYLKYGNSMSGTPTSANDIPTLNSYVPMKFTKVTIGNLKGLPFPDLGNVVYRKTNKIATKLTNGKGNEATKYIQYDIMAFWNEADANKGLEAGNLKCEKFYGNTCHQIYFKPQGELRDQCYLVYDKAWVEKELEPNKWYTMASPLQYIYAGDMYVPAKDGRQETKAFTDITFDTNVYSRSKYPVYQRAWMKSEVKEITPNGEYPASHYPSVAAPENVDMNLGYWSHVYNKVDESYAADGTFGGFSIKAGNALLPKDKTKKALLRLPKADTEYQYFDYKGNENSSSKTRIAKDAGHGKFLVAYSNDEKTFAEKTQALGTDNASGFYLVANPYTCSISMAKFFEANTGLQKAIWIVENGEAKAISSTELDKQNYAIQPTQSFFVKKKVGETVENVRFTSTMCVDRTITPGLLMASDYVKTVQVETENSNGQTSRARIALRPEASADYDDQEDVDLLYDQNLKDIPQVYTVAGNEAVAVNAVPELSWIPLGIVSQQAEEVSLTLKGVNKLDAPVYLYDAASASFTEVHEGEAVKVKAGDHGRYFLTQTRTSTGIDRMETEEQSAPVKVYSPAAGMIVVSALGGEKLDRVQVFTLDGKMVHSYQLPDKQRMILRVPSGIYIVKASTQSCAQAKGQKISVR